MCKISTEASPSKLVNDNDLLLVKTYLEYPIVHLSGFQYRAFLRMGDRLAVAFSTVLSDNPAEGVDEGILQKILIAVRLSFSTPDYIDDPRDRLPTSAISLMKSLHSSSSSAEQKASIGVVMDELQRGRPQSRGL
jgi:hypothetical protein